MKLRHELFSKLDNLLVEDLICSQTWTTLNCARRVWWAKLSWLIYTAWLSANCFIFLSHHVWNDPVLLQVAQISVNSMSRQAHRSNTVNLVFLFMQATEYGFHTWHRNNFPLWMILNDYIIAKSINYSDVMSGLGSCMHVGALYPLEWTRKLEASGVWIKPKQNRQSRSLLRCSHIQRDISIRPHLMLFRILCCW